VLPQGGIGGIKGFILRRFAIFPVRAVVRIHFAYALQDSFLVSRGPFDSCRVTNNSGES